MYPRDVGATSGWRLTNSPTQAGIARLLKFARLALLKLGRVLCPISLKRSTKNLRLSTSSPADYPIFQRKRTSRFHRGISVDDPKQRSDFDVVVRRQSATRPGRSRGSFAFHSPPPSVRGSGRSSKRPSLCFGGVPFVETVRAIPRGDLEQAGGLVPGTGPQRHFAA